MPDRELKPPLHKVPKCNAYITRFFFRLFAIEMFGVAGVAFPLTVFTTLDNTGRDITIYIAICYGVAFWICGPISGPQIHMGVSLVMLFTRRIAYPFVIVAIAGQFAGGIVGCGLGVLITGKYPNETHHYGVSTVPESSTQARAVGMELIGIFWIMFLALNAVDEFRLNHWAVGHITVFPFMFTMCIVMIAPLLAPFSGPGLNPAVTLGASIVNNYYKDWWVYFVGPIAGALLAGFIYDLLLANGASLARLRHWFRDPDFDRTIDYRNLEKGMQKARGR